MSAGSKRAVAFLVAALVLILLAMAVAPAAHAWAVEHAWSTPEKFPKVLRRLVVVPLVLLTLWMFRPWRDGGLRSYGLVGPRARLRPAVFAYVATVAVLLAILAIHVATGWLVFDQSGEPHEIYRRLPRWFALGWAIALAEEWFFRGWLDRRLGRALAPRTTALVVAVLYALLHLFEASPPGDQIAPTWRGSLETVGRWLSQIADVSASVPTFVGLVLLSLLLTAAWRRTGTLWVPVAMHAAGIWVLKTYGALTERVPVRTWAGTKDVYDGPPGWLVILLVLWAVTRRSPRPDLADPGSARG